MFGTNATFIIGALILFLFVLPLWIIWLRIFLKKISPMDRNVIGKRSR
ncbi:MAG: hypothetical protein AB7Y74_00710 [Syntrophorhabdus sp.]